MKLGVSFKVIRKNKGYTQKNITEGIITQGAYSKFESGNSELSASSYIELLNRLHMTSEEFIFVSNGFEHRNQDSIIQNFFELPYNDTQQLRTLKTKVNNLLKSEVDPLLKDIYTICDAMIILAERSNLNAARKLVNPIWERLSKRDNWYLSEIRLINVILYLFPIDTAIEMTRHVLNQLERYNGFQDTNRLKITFNMNLSLLFMKSGNYQSALTIINNLLVTQRKSLSYISLALCFSRSYICYFHLGKNKKEYIGKVKQLLSIYEDELLWEVMKKEIHNYCGTLLF